MAYQSTIYKCSACSVLFLSMEDIHGHSCGVINQTQDDCTVTQYECPHCFVQFPSIEGLNAHKCKEETTSITKKVLWSLGMTKCLISLYVEYRDEMDSIDITKKRVYDKIAEEMGLRGFPGLSGDMCQEKFKSLKRRYKEISDKKKKTGTAAHRFAFYKEMDDIFGKDPDIHPPVIYNSSKNGPTYREDVAAVSSFSKTLPLSQEDLNAPSTSQQTQVRLENEAVTPKRSAKRELPYWCNLHFSRMDEWQAKRDEEKKRKEERLKRKDELRQRREEERQKRHEERQAIKLQMLDLLREIKNKK